MELIGIGFMSQNFGNKLQEDKPHKIQINKQNKVWIFLSQLISVFSSILEMDFVRKQSYTCFFFFFLVKSSRCTTQLQIRRNSADKAPM